MGPTKVFVGNLSFKTKEAELADEFSTAGKVVTANIITRGYRSLGYGFVEFETNEKAQKALDTLNKKNINGREINVELATPREEGAPRPPRGPRRGNSRGGRGGYPPRENQYAPREDSPYSGERRGGGYQGRGRGGGNRRGGGAPASPSGEVQNRPAYNNDNAEHAQRAPPRGGRNFRRGGGRPPRSPQNNNNRVPSTTTLFVANLPYQLTDDELFNLLPKVSKAYVAKNYNGRSKGFGFVEFANEDDQKVALNASEKLQVQGRELIVKIALTDSKKPAEATPEQPRA